jgi:hypothetical protein
MIIIPNKVIYNQSWQENQDLASGKIGFLEATSNFSGKTEGRSMNHGYLPLSPKTQKPRILTADAGSVQAWS